MALEHRQSTCRLAGAWASFGSASVGASDLYLNEVCIICLCRRERISVACLHTAGCL